MNEPTMFPESYVKEIRAESGKHRSQRNTARRLVEELTDEVERVRTERDALLKEIAEKAVHDEVMRLAGEANVVDLEDVYTLLDHEAIAGDVANVPEALTNLLSSSPWLVREDEE